MIGALIAASGAVVACVAALVWLVTVIRTDGRERGDALVEAEKARSALAVASAFHIDEIDRLAADLRRATRRADVVEEWARNRITGGVDDGTDLLLAELSIIAAGVDAEASDGGEGTGESLPLDAAAGVSTGGGDGDAPFDDTLPGVKPS